MKNVNRQQLLACLPSLQPLDTTSLTSPTSDGLPCCQDDCPNLSLRELSISFLPQVSGAHPLSNLLLSETHTLVPLALW